eukprot:SAG31_NODE_498_length_14861_cov_3.405026_5_plen_485_part_00
MVESKIWDNISNFVILFNVFIMMLEHYEMSRWLWDLLEVLNFACLVFFSLEAVCKLLGYYPSLYWHDTWNKLDISVVIVSWLAIISDLGSVQAVRAIRTFRIVLVLKRAKGIRSLCSTLVMSIPPAVNISVLMALLYSLYAILGMQLFGNTAVQDVLYWQKLRCWNSKCVTIMIDRSQYNDECTNQLAGDVPVCTPVAGAMLHGGNRQYTSHASFRSFFSATSLLFQCATGQDWKFVMYALGDDARSGVFIYFASFFFLSNYILANLFIAVILDNFSSCLREQELEITEDDIAIFKEEYRHLVDDNTPELIYWENLELLLRRLGDRRGVCDATGAAREFPLTPPFTSEWNDKQQAVWTLAVAGRKTLAVSELREFCRSLYEQQPLVDEGGNICNPLYGDGQPAGFGPSGTSRDGGQFHKWWQAFCTLRTTSVERVGQGDPQIEAALEELGIEEHNAADSTGLKSERERERERERESSEMRFDLG